MIRAKNTAIMFMVSMIMVVAMALATVSPAQAMPAYLAIHNQGDSTAHIDVIMYVPASGVNYETNVYPGDTIGEPAYAQSNAEPTSYYNRASWCSKWWWQVFSSDGSNWVETNPTYRGGPVSSGVWVSVRPPEGSTDRHIVRVKTWNC